MLRRWEYGCEGGGSIDMCRVHQIFCGDGRLQTNNGETCDDGNTNPTDACNDSCQPNTPEITIEKDDADDSDDAQQVVSGGTATFTITVRNSGTESLKNVVVGDALASDCYRSAVDTAALYTGSTFDPGESFEYTCQRDNVQEETFPMDKNVATVSAR